MSKYIDIESVGIGRAKREQFLVPEYADGWNHAIEIFESEPAADVGRVKHGRWIETEWTYKIVWGERHIPSFVMADYANELTLDNFKECIRKAHPVECERLQTLPDGYTEGVSPTARYRCVGNGWTVDMIAWILHTIFSVRV